MNIGEAVAARMLELCEQHHITLNKLGTISGVTQSTLNNIVNGGSKKPTVSTVKKVCDGLDMSLKQFFDAEVFSALEQEVQ